MKVYQPCMISYLDRSQVIMNHKTVKNQQAIDLAYKDI